MQLEMLLTVRKINYKSIWIKIRFFGKIFGSSR
jgi:hypothetical protein